MKNDFQEIKELINELIEISSKQLNNLIPKIIENKDSNRYLLTNVPNIRNSQRQKQSNYPSTDEWINKMKTYNDSPKKIVVTNFDNKIFQRFTGRVKSILIVPVENSLETMPAPTITANNVAKMRATSS